MYTADRVNLMQKGSKYVDQYMRRCGYQLYEFNEDTRVAEYVKTTAGVTVKTAYIYCTTNMRVKEVQ